MPSSLEDLLTALELIPPVDPSDTFDSSDVNKNSTTKVPTAGHCVNQFIDYIAEYYNTILDESNNSAAVSRSDIMKTYKIEETSPCEVAELAGLFDADTIVYLPNREKVKRKCSTLSDSSVDSSITTNSSYDDNEDLEMISVKRDLIQYTTPEHLHRLRQLFARLGYEYSED